jgi:hypothetical protein
MNKSSFRKRLFRSCASLVDTYEHYDDLGEGHFSILTDVSK